MNRRILQHLLFGTVFAVLMSTGIRPLFAQTDADFRPQLQIDIPTVQFSTIEVTAEDGIRTVDIPWIAEYLSGAYRWAIVAAAVIGTVMVMVGGFEYLTAAGSSGRTDAAKKRIMNGVMGIVLTLGAYTILYTINPDLVNMRALEIEIVRRVEFAPNETELNETTGPDIPLPPRQGEVIPSQIVHIGQCSSALRNMPYPSSNCSTNPDTGETYTICSSGCGIAAAAMVVGTTQGGGGTAIVSDLARLATEHNYRRCNDDCTSCYGTDPKLFTDSEIMGRYGLAGRAIGRNQIDETLLEGIPVIALYKRGLFTGGGHYVVIAGINPDGTYKVFDPARSQNPRAYGESAIQRSGFPTTQGTIRSDAVPSDFIFDNLAGAWVITQRTN